MPPAEAQGKGRPSPLLLLPLALPKAKEKENRLPLNRLFPLVITGAQCASHFAAAEWTSAAKLTSPTQIRKALENGDPDFPGNVVLTRDPKNPE